MIRRAALGITAVLLSTPAAADPAPKLGGFVERVAQRLAEASAAHVPPRVPPVPIKVTWAPRRRASIELGAPLATLAAGDLDGDGKAELYAVSDDAIVAYDVGAAVTERARVALPLEPATPRPREAIAAAALVPATAAAPASLAVRVASRARGASYVWRDAKLVESGAVIDFPVCADLRVALVPARNHFGTVGAPVYCVACRDDLVDATGAPLHAVATLGAGGELRVEVGTAEPGSTPTVTALTGVGVGFQLADLDHDGGLEVIAAGAGAPGDADAVRVVKLTAATAKKPWLRRAFSAGVVATVVGDFDGDGDDEVWCATRLVGSTRIDLWQLSS